MGMFVGGGPHVLMLKDTKFGILHWERRNIFRGGDNMLSEKWFLGLTVLMVLLMPSLARMETPGFSVSGTIIFTIERGPLY